VLTDAGGALQARMWKVYTRANQRHVGDKLDENFTTALGDLLGRLIAARAP
jgi:hypothetical protein